MSAPAPLFDRSRIARNLARRPDAASEPDFVTRLVLDDLVERVATITRRFERALIMGPDMRHLPTRLTSAEGPFDLARTSTLLAADGTTPVTAVAPELAEGDHDLVISLFDLAIIDEVPQFLAAIRQGLRPDGLFLGAFVGGMSLNELRAAWLDADSRLLGGAVMRVAPFIDTRDAGGLLQAAGFALPVTDIETHTVRYADPLSLMAELKALGAANPLVGREQALVTPAHLAAAAEAYTNRFADPDGRIRATLELIWLSGWAPHESQQKPLAPGSAEVSLTSVLGGAANG